MDTRIAAHAAAPTLAQAAARRFDRALGADTIIVGAPVPTHVRAVLDRPEARAMALVKFPKPHLALASFGDSPVGRALASAKFPKQPSAIGSLPAKSGEK